MSIRSPILVLTMLTIGVAVVHAGDWTPPRRVTGDSTPGIRQYYHSVCGRDTTLMVVWAEVVDSVHTLKASRYSSEQWTGPETITDDRDDMVAAACLDADRAPWVVWSVMRRLPDSAYSLWSRKQGDTWTHPRFVTTDPMVWGVNADVASDPNQGIWSVWIWIGDSTNSYLSVFSSYCIDDTWATPTALDRCARYTQPYSTLITYPPGGTPRAVWTGTSAGLGLYTAMWLGDSWSRPEFIPNSQMAWDPSVCSDSSGGTWVTWLGGWAHDSVCWAYHDGTGWTDGGKLGTGAVWGGSACCDELGRIWALWTYYREEEDSTDIWVRYFETDTWSDPILAISTADLAFEARLAPAFGRLWAVWLRFPSWLLYYSHSPPVGISERTTPVRSDPPLEPTIVRGMLELTGMAGAELLDICGRRVMDLQPGANDIRHLAPGVYFVREKGPSGEPSDGTREDAEHGSEGSSVRKVVIQR